MLSPRRSLGPDWVALAEIVATTETLAEHMRCGLAVPGRLARLRERVEREVNRVQVEIVNRPQGQRRIA